MGVERSFPRLMLGSVDCNQQLCFIRRDNCCILHVSSYVDPSVCLNIICVRIYTFAGVFFLYGKIHDGFVLKRIVSCTRLPFDFFFYYRNISV